MVALIIGLALVIVGVVLWVGGISVAHALAILIGAVGLLFILFWALPGNAWGRRVP